MGWGGKFLASILIDLFDMTIGRALFVVPFSGEIIGVAAGWAMFGPKALFYLFEGVDPTEQLDGFIPTATIIALVARKDHA